MTRQEFLKTFSGLVADYHPSAEALERIEAVCLLIVIGPSGVGKSSIIDRLGLDYVPSDTTRPARAGEENGEDMFFLSDYGQVLADIKAGKFLQIVQGVSGDFYGTRASSYPAEGWATLPVLSDVVPYFREMGFKKTLSVFITPPDYQEWMRRMGAHRLNAEQLQRRLAEGRRSLEFALRDSQIHFILNDRLDDAVSQVRALIDGTIDKNREQNARAAAQSNLDELIKTEK